MAPRLVSIAVLTLVMSAVVAVGIAVPSELAVRAAAPSVTLTLSCYGNPQKVTIKNARTSAITASAVGSIYMPYAD